MWVSWLALLCALPQWVAPSSVEAEVEFSYDPEVSEPEGSNPWPVTTYKSSTARPPYFKVTNSGRPLAPGYLLVTPEKHGEFGAFMFKNDGDLVWSGYQHHLSSNAHTATLNGKNVMSTWTGRSSTRGFGYGGTSILDDTYKQIHYICPKLGLYIPKFDNRPPPACQGDLHESEITTDGNLIVTAYNVTRANLASVGGPTNGWVIDGQFHVIDIATQAVVFSWSSLDYVPINESLRPLGNSGSKDTKPYDYFHINSVEQVPGGNQYLVSARHTSSIYLVNSDGSLAWTFNGYNGGDFGPLPHAPQNDSAFAYQHHARIVSVKDNAMTISMFNDFNAEFDPRNHYSTGLIYRLNMSPMTCDLVRYVYDPKAELYSVSQGSFEALHTDNGRHFLIGYGSNPVVKEFGPNGVNDLRYTVRFGEDGSQQFYRAYRVIWRATPSTPPSIAVDSGKGYVSWNGATEVTRYVLYYGSSRSSLNKKMHFVKSGFETSFALPNSLIQHGGYIRVGAFSATGFLRKSAVLGVKPTDGKI